MTLTPFQQSIMATLTQPRTAAEIAEIIGDQAGTVASTLRILFARELVARSRASTSKPFSYRLPKPKRPYSGPPREFRVIDDQRISLPAFPGVEA